MRWVTTGVEHVVNREALEERFSRWPSFHDAEVLAVRLDNGQRDDGRPSVELDVHVFEVTDRIKDGHFVVRLHSLVTFRFEGAADVELSYFSRQNVLAELEFERLEDGGAAPLQVLLPSNAGLDGSLRCEKAIVLTVEPFDPGPHSVYGRPRS